MKKPPFKLRSGNKPSMAKIAGVSPMKQDKKMKATFEETPNKNTLKMYREAMDIEPNKRTKFQKDLIAKVNELRSKEQAKVGENIDEID